MALNPKLGHSEGEIVIQHLAHTSRNEASPFHPICAMSPSYKAELLHKQYALVAADSRNSRRAPTGAVLDATEQKLRQAARD
jgi:hypothetical protein